MESTNTEDTSPIESDIPEEFLDPEQDAELQGDEPLERSDRDLRRLWDLWLCRRNGGAFVAGSLFGRNIGSIPKPSVDAYAALEQALQSSGYQPRSAWSYNCRPIGGTNISSLHSFGIAIDIDPQLNPYTSGDPYSGALKPHHVSAVLGIKNSRGESVWSWGGNWRTPDRMHFQLDQGPDRVDVDWATVPDSDKTGEIVLTTGSNGAAVVLFQDRLMAWSPEALPKFGADGDFGTETADWVAKYQESFDLPVASNIDGVTAALLMHPSAESPEA